jgi:Ras-related protein Rab-1A
MSISNNSTNKNEEIYIKILILGDSTVGKTTLLLKYVDCYFPKAYIATIGVEYKVKKININGLDLNLQIWDSAGQERFLGITKNFMKGADGIIYMYDITNKESFDNLKNWIMQSEESIEDFKKIIIGNKIDLEKERQVTKELLEQFCQGRDIQGFEISAKNDVNNIEISKCFETLVQIIIEGKSKEQLLDRFSEDSRSRSKSVISYNKHTKKRKKKCC